MTIEHTVINNMVHEDYVDRRVYTDQQVFELEMERIFEKTWIYVAHSSQVRNSGDYITTTIGRRPMLLVRGEDGQLRIFYNRCSHRGAKIMVENSGNVSRLVCNFHSYCYRLNGSIESIPLQNSYQGVNFDDCDPTSNLKQAAQISDYRGFIFANLSGHSESLEQWLGDVITSIDNFVDRSPTGEVEVVGPPLRWINNCNWKMLIENIVDGMHVVGTHPSIAQAGAKLRREYRASNQQAGVLEQAQSFHRPAQWLRDMGTTMLRNGHCYNGGNVSVHSDYSDIEGYYEALKSAYGKDRTEEILSLQRHSTCIYPNVHFKNLIQKLRIFKPVAPDKTITECWVFRLKGAPDELFNRSLTYAQLLDSPSTLVSTDDVEVMTRMQTGLAESVNTRVSMQRGKNRPVTGDSESRHCEGDSELPYSYQFQTWKLLMNNEEK